MAGTKKLCTNVTKNVTARCVSGRPHTRGAYIAPPDLLTGLIVGCLPARGRSNQTFGKVCLRAWTLLVFGYGIRKKTLVSVGSFLPDPDPGIFRRFFCLKRRKFLALATVADQYQRFTWYTRHLLTFATDLINLFCLIRPIKHYSNTPFDRLMLFVNFCRTW